MIKKGLIAGGVLVSAFVLTIGLVFAQTPTESPSASPTMTASPATVPTATSSPSATVPTGAPATGMAAY